MDHVLEVITLGTSDVETRPNVGSAQVALEGSHRWLVYRRLPPDKGLHILDLKTNAERSIPTVEEFWYTGDGRDLLVQSTSESDSQMHRLSWINLINGAIIHIWQGSAPHNIIVNASGKQLAFMVAESSGESVWYFEARMACAEKVFDPKLQPLDAGLTLFDIQEFLAGGTHLLVHLAQPLAPPPVAAAVNVDVWSYKDAKTAVATIQGNIGYMETPLCSGS